jgi:phage terminase large subunit
MRAQIKELPKITQNFAKPARTRVFKGGRGSGKTRGLALRSALRVYQLAEMGVEGVFLASREHLNSLDESSMEEIKAAIRSVDWLHGYFEIGEKYIRTRNRRISYAFAGLRHNLDSIKSKARIIGNWTDEAESVSEVAWRKLIPTIREGGKGWVAENWISYNPERDDSATHRRFVADPADDCIVTDINWRDNPWFPEVLNLQRLEDQRRRPDVYAHIWDGEFKRLDEARVFRNWRIEAFDTPSNAEFRFGADWGFAVDPTVLVRCYLDGRTLYVDQCAWEVGCEIDKTPALFDQIEGSRKWTVTADSARPETVSYMRRQGFRIVPAIKGPGSIEDGIEFLKSFDIVVHPRCQHVADELTLFSFKTDSMTGDVLPVLEDKNNHTIDALRYALEALRRTWKKPVLAPAPVRDRWDRRREEGPNWKTA